MRVDQAVDGLVAGDARADEDREHDREAGDALGARAAQREGDRQRDRRRGVAEVVDEVGQQRDAAGRDEHDELRDRGRAEDEQREPDGPQALARALDRLVHEAVAVAMAVAVVVVVPVAVSVVLVRGVVARGRGRGHARRVVVPVVVRPSAVVAHAVVALLALPRGMPACCRARGRRARRGSAMVSRAPLEALEPRLEAPDLRDEVALARPVHELELDGVRVVEEDRVVAGRVVVLARAALDRRALLAQPRRALVDRRARRGAEREVVQADRVAVVGDGCASDCASRRLTDPIPPTRRGTAPARRARPRSRSRARSRAA